MMKLAIRGPLDRNLTGTISVVEVATQLLLVV